MKRQGQRRRRMVGVRADGDARAGACPEGRIRADSTPSQNGSAIDNQIARTDEPMTQGGEHTEHEEGLGQWGASPLLAFPLLGRTGNAGTTILAQRQAKGQG